MRMWGVPAEMMCNKHLLGEHVEIHMLVGCIKKGKSIKGYVEKGLVDTSKIRERHNELVWEMLTRGFEHKSELPFFVCKDMGSVDIQKNIEELKRRCPVCLNKMERGEENGNNKSR